MSGQWPVKVERDREEVKATVKSYRDLIVWQKAMELLLEIYKVTASFPKEEMYGLVSQLRRSAVSIPSNIAEGQGRSSTGEFVQFPGHARGSLFEVETQILAAKSIGLVNSVIVNRLLDQTNEVGRVLNGLMGSLR